MKPTFYKKFTQTADQSFLVRYAEVPHTYDRFHYHKEYELMYHIENRGTRFVGDSIERFGAGDLVLVGPNTPHYWLSDDVYYEGRPDLKAKVVLIQFTPDFLGEHFFRLPELHAVQLLLTNASRGIHIHGKDAKNIGAMIRTLPGDPGWDQLLKLIRILCMMSESHSINLLASAGFSHARWYRDEQRIGKIFDFLVRNHQRDIELADVAEHVGMNKSAFCRYFKRTANKTFSQAMNEIRVGVACREMLYSDRTIAEIAFGCGYVNIPYFNRIFKKIKGCTPNDYRLAHRSGELVPEA